MSSLGFDFDALRELHDSVNDLLDYPVTKLEIINHGQEKCANEVSEASLKMADSCAAAKDLVLLAKDHLQHLQSTFRRKAATSEIAKDYVGNQFAPYRLPRKQLKKAILTRMHSLKGIKNEGLTASPEDQKLVGVVNLLNEVRATILSIVKSLSSLISMPSPEGKSNPKEARRFKLTRVDSLIMLGKYDASAIRSAVKRLKAVEIMVEDMEGELERIFRRLIRTRASLLNIITS